MFTPQGWFNAENMAKGTANLASAEKINREWARNFEDETERCINGLLINFVLKASKEALSRHPQHAQAHGLIQSAFENPDQFWERMDDACLAMAGNYNETEFADDPKFNVLIGSVFWRLYRNSTDEGVPAALSSCLERVLTGPEVLGLYELGLFGCMLWYADYDGFRARTLRAYKVVLQERAEKERAAQAEKEQEKQRAAERRAQQSARWRQAGRCQHCGGAFKGLLQKRCASCDRQKDY